MQIPTLYGYIHRVATATPALPIPSTNLVGWWRINSITASEGGIIPQWNDESGNNYHLTSSAGREPVYRAAGINGFGAVRFDGTNDAMCIPLAALQQFHSSSQSELFIVARKSAQADGKGLYNVGNDANYNLHTFTNGAFIEGWCQNTNGFITAPPANLLTNPFIWDAWASGSSGTGFNTYLLTISASTGTKYSGSQGTATQTYGALPNYRWFGYGGRGSQTTAYASASFCEIIIYKQKLSGADRATVQSYLSSKYGIA